MQTQDRFEGRQRTGDPARDLRLELHVPRKRERDARTRLSEFEGLWFCGPCSTVILR